MYTTYLHAFYTVHVFCQEPRAILGSRVEQSINIRYRLSGYPEAGGFQRRRWLRTISTASLHFSTASENLPPQQPSTVAPIDTSIVVVYLSGVALLGVYFSRRQKTTEDYFLAARSVPGWVVAFSILGTICGSATFVGHPGNVFHDNMFLIPAHMVPLIVMLLLARRIVVFYRHSVRMTAYEYLEQRFGYPARAYGAATFLVSRVADVSVTYYFLALATALLTGWNVTGVILILGAITVLYTLIGGIQAVVWTDVVQGIFLVGGGLLCILLILFGSDADPSQIVSAAWEGGKFEIDRWQWDATENNQWLLIIGSVFVWLQAFCCNQHNVQRYLLARSDREAVRGAVMGAAACVPVWLLFMLLGALLWSYYQFSAEAIPPDVMAVKDRIVPYFVSTHFPAGLKGLVLAALIAARHVLAGFGSQCAGDGGSQRLLRPAAPPRLRQPQAAGGQDLGHHSGRCLHSAGAPVDQDRQRLPGRVLPYHDHDLHWGYPGTVRPGHAVPVDAGQRGLPGYPGLPPVYRLGHPDPAEAAGEHRADP